MKFGSISNEHLQMTECAFDKDAEALILGDFGITRMYYQDNIGFLIEHTRHLRVKIFKQTAVDEGNVLVELYKSGNTRETISRVKGFTYNLENGKVEKVKLTKEGIFEEEITPYLIVAKISLPQVKEGSVFELQYSVQSEFLFNLPEWSFQSNIPALFSEYRVYTPEYFTYKQLTKGYLNFNISEQKREGASLVSSGNRVNYVNNSSRWRIDNVPAFKEEPFISSKSNYMAAVEFELSSFNPPFALQKNYTSTWQKINEELMKSDYFGQQIKRGSFLRSETATLSEGFSTDMDRMVGAYDFIRSHMEWNGYNSIYTTRNLRTAYNNRRGNSADVNLMLVLLLRELGLNANPVILSTRSNGILHPGQIMLTKFNYVIAQVKIDDKTYLLDATEKRCPYFMLPQRCLNDKGRIISENFTDWVSLSGNSDRTRTMVNLTMDAEGNITGDFTRQNDNYSALRLRNKLARLDSHDELIKEIESKNPYLKITDFEFVNLDSINAPVIEKYSIEIVNELPSQPTIQYLNPIIAERYKVNPFKMERREYPVDYAHPFSEFYILNLILPENYAIDEMPTSTINRMPNREAEFSYRTANQNNIFQCTYEFKVNKSLFLPMEYNQLKEFYELIVSKHAESIVIKTVDL